MKYKKYTGPFGKPLKPITGHIEDYFEELRRVFETFVEIKIVYLFGSHAKGDLRKTSDVDIAIVAPNIGLDGYKKLWSDTRDVLSTERFDFIALDNKPVSFRFEVISKGRPIYFRNKDFLNDFELRTIKAYLDTNYLRSQNAKVLEERLNGL